MLGEFVWVKVFVCDDVGIFVGEISVGFECNGVFDDFFLLFLVIGFIVVGVLGFVFFVFLFFCC